ncbi:MAG: peptidylprolyl isomerase [Kiritimatiellia bacterium]
MLKLNGETISDSAVDFEYNRLMRFYSRHMSAEEMKNQSSLLRRKAKEQAIGAKLLIERAKHLDITVDQSDVDRRFRKLIRDAGGEEAFSQILRARGLSEEQFRKTLEEGLKVDKLIEQIAGDTPEPAEEDIREHFEQHKREYRRQPRAQAQHILVKPHSGSESDRQTAVSRLERIRQRAVEGADFAELASVHSECPSGRKAGGSLGWVSKGMMVPELDCVVFSMNVGDISEIVETELGFHIVRKTDREDGGEADLDMVREKVLEFLRHARRGQAVSAYVEDLKRSAVIEEV